jgi:predicted DNA-binding protein
MKKLRTSFALSAEVIELLKKLAEKNNRSQANMIEELIKEAAKKEKL